jgi:hypothetical protein
VRRAEDILGAVNLISSAMGEEFIQIFISVDFLWLPPASLRWPLPEMAHNLLLNTICNATDNVEYLGENKIAHPHANLKSR